jgi:hypothetical protein
VPCRHRSASVSVCGHDSLDTLVGRRHRMPANVAAQVAGRSNGAVAPRPRPGGHESAEDR